MKRPHKVYEQNNTHSRVFYTEQVYQFALPYVIWFPTATQIKRSLGRKSRQQIGGSSLPTKKSYHLLIVA